MIERYGKSISMSSIGRNISRLEAMSESGRQNCERYYLGAERPGQRCRVCGSNDMELFVQMNDQYSYYLCKNCGCVVLANLPDIAKMYCGEEATGNNAEYISKDVYQQRVKMISAPKVDFVLNVCEEEKITPRTWLDVGCGGGEILSYLKTETDIQGTGIESDKKEIAFGRSLGLNIVDCYIDPESDNKEAVTLIARSDVISFINVLEHIEKPAEFIDFLHRNMCSGALVVFEVPRHPSIASLANLTHNRIIYRHIVPPIHLQIFSEKAVHMLLDGKFRFLGKWAFGQGFTDLVNYAMLSSGTSENDLYFEVLRASNNIQFAADQSGLADQMFIVAQKE